MTVVNAKAGAAEQKAAWDFLAWLNSPKSGKNGASAMSDILMSMGILPSRSSDIEAHKAKLGTEFLAGYVSVLADAKPFPVVAGGQEFSESLQQTLEALQYGQVSAGRRGLDPRARRQVTAAAGKRRAAEGGR